MIANDPRLAEVFPHCPLVAYKRPPNLKELLIRAKLPPISRSLRPARIVKGCKPCNKPCAACPYVTHTKTIKSSVTGVIVHINAPVDCSTTWVIYIVTCLKRGCKMQYVGKTEREFRTRVKEHVRYIETGNVSQATGQHFCQRSHNITDFSIAILEKVNTNDTLYIEEREREWIRKFNCKFRGINRSYWQRMELVAIVFKNILFLVVCSLIISGLADSFDCHRRRSLTELRNIYD